jgi:hypothetical protein
VKIVGHDHGGGIDGQIGGNGCGIIGRANQLIGLRKISPHGSQRT